MTRFVTIPAVRRALVPCLLAALALGACSTTDDGTAGAGTAGSTAGSTGVTDSTAGSTTTIEVAPSTPDTTTAGTDTIGSVTPPDPSRPYEVFTPTGYDDATPSPLVVLLHGYGASGALQEAYLAVQTFAEEKNFLYVHPDGTRNVVGDQFWNATDACCGFGSGVDDVAYLTGIIDSVSAQWNVDPKRVYLIGHSNGGFMSYRMACDASDRIAAIASLAGATFSDASRCDPSEPVSVLQVHGTADATIAYEGGTTPIINGTYPGAVTTVTTWAGYNGCDTTPVDTGDSFDYESNLAGDDTTVQAFEGCPTGIDVELWTIEGGSHLPAVGFPDGTRPLIDAMLDFLLEHPKP